MLELTKRRTVNLQSRLRDAGVDLAILTDQDSIAYFGGFWGYLGVEFGRPTFMLVPADGECSVITPLMESEMVAAMTWVEKIQPWQDAGTERWENVLRRSLPGDLSGSTIGWEALKTSPLVSACIASGRSSIDW